MTPCRVTSMWLPLEKVITATDVVEAQRVQACEGKDGWLVGRSCETQRPERYGHRLRWRGRPDPEGQGQGERRQSVQCKRDQGEGEGANGKGLDKGKGKGTPFCGHCGKRGHDASRCWTLHPDQLPWKSTNVVEENYNYLVDHSDNSGISVCGLECDAGAWQTVVRKRQKASKNCMEAQPGLKDDNRFDKLSETYDVGGLEVLMLEKAIGRVGTAEKLRSAGK